MAKRLILMLVVMAGLLSVLGFVKFRQIESAVHPATFQPPPEAVTSIVTQREQWAATMPVIGTMEAVYGVTVRADLPGNAARINFYSGTARHDGEGIVQLNTRRARA